MKLIDRKVGFALTGSHCTLERVLPALEGIVAAGARVTPVVSRAVAGDDTRFGKAQDWLRRIQEICGQQVIDTIVGAEPIGPKKLFDLLIIAPCTGNTIAKIARGIIDETVVMAAKAHLRNQSPLLLAVATNDGLGLNAANISCLLNTENIFFVPFGQDNPRKKPNSLVARMDLIERAAEKALERKQIQPVLIEYRGL